MPPYFYAVGYQSDALTIFDLSDPLLPLIGSIQGAGTPPGGNWLYRPIRLVVFNNIAYVAAQLEDSLTIIDVSNPAAPALLGNIRGAGAPPGGNWLDAISGVFLGNGSYNGLAYCTALADNALTIIDVSDPTNPSFVGSIQGAGGPNFLSSPRCVYVRGDYAYVTAGVDNALTIINVSNPAAPVFAGSIQGAGAIPWLGHAEGLFVEGDYAYVAV